MHPKERNFTQIENELLEAFARQALTPNQFSVLLALMRLTLGFHQLFRRLTDNQIGAIAELARQKVNEAKQALIGFRVLEVRDGQIGFNLNISEWTCGRKNFSSNLPKKPKKKPESVTSLVTPESSGNDSESVTSLVTDSVTSLVTESVTSLVTHINKEIKTKEITAYAGKQSEPESEDQEVTEQPGKSKRPKTSKADHGAMFDAMKAGLPGARGWRSRNVMSDDRKRMLDKFWKFANDRARDEWDRPFTLADFEGYLAYICENEPWTLTGNTDAQGRNWQPRDWDYFLRLKVAERLFDGLTNR